MVPETIEILSIAVPCQNKVRWLRPFKNYLFRIFPQTFCIFVLKGIVLMSQGNVMTFSVEKLIRNPRVLFHRATITTQKNHRQKVVLEIIVKCSTALELLPCMVQWVHCGLQQAELPLATA